MRSQKTPVDRMMARAVENCSNLIEELLDTSCSVGRGDSPIERFLFAALYTEIRCGFHEFSVIIAPIPNSRIDESKLDFLMPLIVESQKVIIDNWPVDFLIRVLPQGDDTAHPGLVVECDGHEFHERTKDQAKRDRSRDRELQERGYQIFRFTGSEIWNDPNKCVDQILNWAVDTVWPRTKHG